MPFRVKLFDHDYEPRSDTEKNKAVEVSGVDKTAPNDDDGSLETLHCFLGNTTLHGARYLFVKSLLRRFLWILALLASLSFCIHQAYQSGKEFHERPFSTKMTTKSTPEDGLIFPAVTLCNFNPLNMKKMRNLLSNPNLTKEEIDKRVDHVSKIMLHPKDAITAEYQERYHKLFNRDRTDAFFKNYSHQIEEMLLPNVPPTFVSCSFNGLLCGAENFSSFTSSYFGQCFTFNSGKNGSPSLKATMAGKNNGLKLRLNIQRDSYLVNTIKPVAGITVLVHDQNNFPFMEEYGFGVEPGTHTFCSVKMKKVRRKKMYSF